MVCGNEQEPTAWGSSTTGNLGPAKAGRGVGDVIHRRPGPSKSASPPPPHAASLVSTHRDCRLPPGGRPRFFTRAGNIPAPRTNCGLLEVEV